MEIAPPSRSRIQDAHGVLKQESSDNDHPLTARFRNREHGNGVRTVNPIANDGSNTIDGVGEPVDQDENQGTDNIAKEDESDQDDKRNVAYGEEGHDNDVDELVNGGDKHVASKRHQSHRHSGPSTGKEQGSSDGTQKEPNSGGQGTTTRRRGRPTTNMLGLGSSSMSANTAMTKSTSGKRKRGVEEDGLRRSSRAAAESATKQITELSTKRPKAASTPYAPSTQRQKKAAPSSGTRNKDTPTRTHAKHEFEVEYILDTRKKAGITEYQVKWKGYHVKDNTWEPAANMTHCPQALKQFRAGWSKK